MSDGAIHSELRFETEICGQLSKAGWLHRDVQPYDEGYDAKLALYPEDAIAWVKETQPAEWEKFAKNHAKNPEEVFAKRLAEELDREKPDPKQPWGTLGILRHGFKDVNAKFIMAQFAPANALNPKTLENFGKNRLRVIRQVHYSVNNGNSIDFVLTLNGIPVGTVELKTDTTQAVDDAKRQYRFDRPPVDPVTKNPEPLLAFGKRALVHFAASTDEVWMTTKLARAQTGFLPFNRGIPDGVGGAGAGNPVDSERGYSTAYFWNDMLKRDVFLEILGKFVMILVEEDEDRKTGKKRFRKKILFPRFHQWDAVSKLVSATLDEGPGKTYLVQHSAGSGKSNTIGWLAHRLSSLHGKDGRKAYDSVVVITDRRVLDRQLQDTIYQFEHQKGVVEKIDENSTQLAEALENGKPIIITTLQKFPFVLGKIGHLADHRFALIVDEAHSSQSGKAALKLREVLSKEDADAIKAAAASEDDEEEITAEDVINRVMASRKRPPNLSYYAFTATPKPKTLELFGRPGADGLPVPFHVYSMRQAIEEKFIIDVLKGYSTYDFAFKLEQSGADGDKEVKSGKARKRLFSYAQWHATSVAQKVAVIVEHYRKHVMRMLDGKAKAMVVTDSRLAAVRHKRAFDEYAGKMGYDDCKALVAFSGTITDAENGLGKSHEGDLNAGGEREDKIKEAFDTDAYNVLIVANKFQTGFDQPLLMAMYVDKRLDGVMAVQTLSRLNRPHPGKETTFVLDFRNKAEDILAAFMPFYRTAALSDITDRNLPHTLREKLQAADVFRPEDVELFSKSYFDPAGKQAGIQAPLKAAAERFRAKKEEERDVFRADMSSYVRAYDFLSQLVDYDDADLEKLHAFAKCLAPRLRTADDGGDDVVDAVSLSKYKVFNRQEHKLDLEKGEAALLKPMGPGGGTPREDPLASLATIVKLMNEVFSGNLTDADMRGYATHLIGKLTEDPILLEQAKANDTVAQFAHGDYRKKLNSAVVNALSSHNAMASQALKDDKVLNSLADILVAEVYLSLRQSSQAAA